MENKITNIKAEEILDSRKNPTLKVTVSSDDKFASFEVPSGASTGIYEAYELRDGENNKSGVSNAVLKINTTINENLCGLNIFDQENIDRKMIELDGTKNKKNLGGNSLIGVSIACAKLSAQILNIEVYQYLRKLKEIKPSKDKPFLYFNLINGGKHASTGPAFQEYHIVPQTQDLQESVEICKKIQEKLDEITIKEYGKILPKGDEGGITLPDKDIFKPLNLLKEIILDLKIEDKVMLALDVAASSFYNHQEKVYDFMDRKWTKEEMINLYKKICSDYNIISIEDPFDEEDFESFSKLQEELKNIILVGDDLTVTNTERLQKAIDQKSIKGIIIKPNQIGTLTETINTISLARQNDINCIVSHRSGETMDDFIADLAYAFQTFGIKSGALGPKERNVKYDRLIKITSK